MPGIIETAYSRVIRPKLNGSLGAVSAGHPLGAAAAQQILTQGGNAVDAAIAAQVALCVVIPASCGLGGDALVLIREPDGTTTAINGTGNSPSDLDFSAAGNGGLAVAVPGIVDAWVVMAERLGRLGLAACLAPAIALCERGIRFGPDMARAASDHADRLDRGGAQNWDVRAKAASGERCEQRELAGLLRAIAEHGRVAFYEGRMADAVERATRATGGLLSAGDLGAHTTHVCEPISTPWQGGRVVVQPPMTQGVLLAMCLKALGELGTVQPDLLDHAMIELTGASFAHRDRAGEGAALLDMPLDIDMQKASLRGGPRAYLHTTGVATSDDEGRVASSLISVFDEFGSGVFVPEGGFVLNNRAQGFTSAPNHAEPAKRPVHTLAPAIVERDGAAIALATPGADGQIQTLLQIIARLDIEGLPLSEAIHRPRWRSETGKLLIAENHPMSAALEALGHAIETRADGDTCFGGVVCAGTDGGTPFAVSDWRREVWTGVA